MELEDLVYGFTATDLARVCKEVHVPVRGFSRKMEMAPRTLVMGALAQALAHGGFHRAPILRELGRIWEEKNPEILVEIKQKLDELSVAPDAEWIAWVVQMGQRLGRGRARQAFLMASELLEGSVGRLSDQDLMDQAMDRWPEDLPLEDEEARGEELESSNAPAQAVTEKEARKATQVKELQQTVKHLKGEIQALERRLKAAQARESALVDSLAQAKARLEVYDTAAMYPEPRERTRRLVKALFEAIREKEALEGEAERLRSAEPLGG